MTPVLQCEPLKVGDISKLLKISPYLVRQLLTAGVIPGIKCGRDWLVNRAIFEEWWAAAGKK